MFSRGSWFWGQTLSRSHTRCSSASAGCLRSPAVFTVQSCSWKKRKDEISIKISLVASLRISFQMGTVVFTVRQPVVTGER